MRVDSPERALHSPPLQIKGEEDTTARSRAPGSPGQTGPHPAACAALGLGTEKQVQAAARLCLGAEGQARTRGLRPGPGCGRESQGVAFQADHVGPGELGGRHGGAGCWNTVPRRSALPRGLLPGPRRSRLQLLQPRAGQMAPDTEQASRQTLPGGCPLHSRRLLRPHRLGHLQLLPLPGGRVLRGWPPLLPSGLPLQRGWASLLPGVR